MVLEFVAVHLAKPMDGSSHAYQDAEGLKLVKHVATGRNAKGCVEVIS